MMRNLSADYSKRNQNIIKLNHKRKNSLNQKAQNSSNIKLKIDDMLRKDYMNWRITKDNFNVLNSQTIKNTENVQKYVQSIYFQYKIPDPLQNPFQIRTQNYSYQSQGITYPQKTEYTSNREIPRLTFVSTPISNKIQNEERNVYTTPIKNPTPILKSNIQNSSYYGMQKSKYRNQQRTAPSLASQFNLNSRVNFGNSTVNFAPSNGNRQRLTLDQSRLSIDNRLRNNNIKMEDSTFTIKPSSIQLNNKSNYIRIQDDKANLRQNIGLSNISSQTGYNKDRRSKIIQNTLNSFQTYQKFTELPINESYRYCVGCQSAVIQANISYHQSTCIQFQKIFNLSINQIISKIDRKIGKISQNIKKRQQVLKLQDVEQIKKRANQMVNQVKIWQQLNRQSQSNKLQQNNNYDISIMIGRKWCLLTEQINKLKWFIKVKENMKNIRLNQAQKLKVTQQLQNPQKQIEGKYINK